MTGDRMFTIVLIGFLIGWCLSMIEWKKK